MKSQTRKPKCTKGYHCSRNAYMLVYKIQVEQSSDSCRTGVEVPGKRYRSSRLRALKSLGSHLFWVLLPLAFLQRLVDQDNHKFEEWCSEMADMRKQSVDKGKAKHEEVKELYELLPARDGR